MTRVCPKCEKAAEKALIGAVMIGHAYGKNVDVPKPVEMKPARTSDDFIVQKLGGFRVYPHVCPVCGYVELWRELE